MRPNVVNVRMFEDLDNYWTTAAQTTCFDALIVGDIASTFVPWSSFLPFSLSRSQSREAPLSAEESEYRRVRGLLWRTWFREWLAAARYLSVRQLLHSRIKVDTFEDNSGGTHFKLHEHLELGSEREMGAEGNAEAEVRWCCVALRSFCVSAIFHFCGFSSTPELLEPV